MGGSRWTPLQRLKSTSKLPGNLHRATDGWAQAETVHNVNYEMLIGLLKWEHSQTAGNRKR